jgi:hypothetical protein
MIQAFIILYLALLAPTWGADVYVADLTPISGSNSSVFGTAVVFVGGYDADIIIGYTGFSNELEPNLVAAECTETNGCGVHIHNGTSCENSDLQGGHFFVSPIVDDPWVDARYSTNESGSAIFSGVVSIGSPDIEGKPFIGTLKIKPIRYLQN